VLTDAHFPGETYAKCVLRADGLKIPDLLDAILPLFALDTCVESPLIIWQYHPEKGCDPNDRKIEPLTIGEYS
jgi:Fucose dissimilation pathway protein FucU